MNSFDSLITTIILGTVCGIIIWPAAGLLGGFTMALIVKSSLKSLSKEGFRDIIIGWIFGIVVGFTICYTAVIFVKLDYVSVVVIPIGGLIAGGIGSGIMYRVIDRELSD